MGKKLVVGLLVVFLVIMTVLSIQGINSAGGGGRLSVVLP